VTITAPEWTLIAPTAQCVTAHNISGIGLTRCGGTAIATIQFDALCGHSGTRSLCERCLARAAAGTLKCSKHEHPVRLVSSERMGSAR
jgi:hypothetical protein